MPLTAFDPVTGLVVIDRPKGIADGHCIPPIGGMQSFAEGWTGFLPESGWQPTDSVGTIRSWSALATTDFEPQLRARCVLTSGRPCEPGFNVSLVPDAITDIREAAREHCIGNVFPRVGETGSARELIPPIDESPAS